MNRNDIELCASQQVGVAFADWLAFELIQECEYLNPHDDSATSAIRLENVRGDSGGLTFAGVDHSAHKEFPFAHPRPEDVVNAYLADWNASKADALPPPLGAALANFTVNCGLTRAVKLLQQALGRQAANAKLQVDGKFGPATLAAALASNPFDLAAALTVEAEAFYRAIAHGERARFLTDWVRRTHELRAWCMTQTPAGTEALA